MKAEEDFIELSNYKGEKVFVCYAPSENKYIVKEKEMVDYLIPYESAVLPIEVKAGTQGGMKSLWQFMREKKLKNAIRASLENFGTFTYTDTEEGAERTVRVCPLFALSQLT